MSEKTRVELMEAELKARKALTMLEARRVRSIALVIKNKHTMFDNQRTKLLLKTDPALIDILVQEGDTTHTEYLARLAATSKLTTPPPAVDGDIDVDVEA